MTKHTPIKKNSWFGFGIILLAVGAITAGMILFLIQTIEVQFMSATPLEFIFTEFVNRVAYVKDTSRFIFIVGIGLTCIGAYVKKQPQLFNRRFLIPLILIIIGLVIDLLFVVIIKNIKISSHVIVTMTRYFESAAYFIVYSGCYLLVRTLIKITNPFYIRKKSLIINDFAAGLFCLYLVLSYIYFACIHITVDADGQHLAIRDFWPVCFLLTASVCECLATVITFYVLLIIQRRWFLNNRTKWIEIIFPCISIIAALACQLDIIANLILLVYVYDGIPLSGALFFIYVYPNLIKAGYWCACAFISTFIPFSILIMMNNSQNVLAFEPYYQ